MADADNTTFDATPEGSAHRWSQEFKAAREELSKWHAAAEKCDARYRDEEQKEGEGLNLYASGVDLKEATLYGNTPRADVERRNFDADDDVARVASEILKRVLNNDLERDDADFPPVAGRALQDWLIPGLGMMWFRLEQKFEPVPEQPARTEPVLDQAGQPVMGEDGQPQMRELAPAVPATKRVVDENVVSDYVFWKDVLWSPCRVFIEMRWMARRALLSSASFKKKFGDFQVPYAIGADPKDPTIPKTPWSRVEVWEIRDREAGCLWYYVDGYQRVLVPNDDDGQPLESNPDGSIVDPLGISTFWPFPEPLVEGATNSKYVPRPSFTRSQDLYIAIDEETTRIGLLRQAIDASCVYDKTVGELDDLLNSRGENKAVPAQNYKALAEKGGIAAAVMWKPLEQIVAAMNQLRESRREDIELLFQVDGTSDIMRGQATDAGATATEQAIKAKYGSIRGGKAQKRFAAFISEAQRIRAEIICKHFSPQTIAERANVQAFPQNDQMLVPQAIELLKSGLSRFRIVVKAESVSLTDFAANRQEAIDVVGMIGGFFQQVGPLVQMAPMLGPKILQLLTVFLARVKGGDTAEPILDEMVKEVQQMAAQAQAQAAQPRPNPQLEVAQVKADAEKTKAAASIQQTKLDMVKNEAEHAQTMQQLEGAVRADAMRAAMAPGAAVG